MFFFVGDIEKTKVTDFKTASSPQEVVSYLSSWERLKKTTHLYHYTKLSSMIGIIKSGYWVMRSPECMNDIFEFENWSQYDWSGVFFASFMGEQKENIGMWSMYAQPWVDGVKIAIDKNTFKNWIKNIKTVYKADPETYEVDEHTTFEIGKDATIKYNAVAYSDYDGTDNGKNESIRCGRAVNEQKKRRRQKKGRLKKQKRRQRRPQKKQRRPQKKQRRLVLRLIGKHIRKKKKNSMPKRKTWKVKRKK